jgi:(S)-2-hydroxyglutarate dehydrogenase
MAHQKCDFLIVGGGVIGISLAFSLSTTFPDASIIVLEKERESGLHASGRNSGVLHAGFYYTADSLKARFTKEGNEELSEFCRAKGLSLNACGKLVVASDEEQDRSLDILYERGQRNGVSLDMLSAKEATEIEPKVRTLRRALYSPATSVVDPNEVLSELILEATANGVRFEYDACFLHFDGTSVHTASKAFEAGYVVNAAGLYADRVAHNFGFGQDYHLLPFKGIYLYGTSGAMPLNTLIYPVPDLRNPFLGVHFTLTVSGQVKIGPTAIPAFWPEQYGWLENFHFDEFLRTTGRHMKLMMGGDPMFRELAFEEVKKYSRSYLVSQASKLADGVRSADFKTWGRSGIRAQLINKNTQKLEMDFIIEGDKRSMHVLNAVSPAFTCALPFSRYVVEQIEKNLS